MMMILQWLMLVAVSLQSVVAFQRPFLPLLDTTRERRRVLPMRLERAALQRQAAVKKEEQLVQAQSTTEEVQNDAREALKAVGWAMPAEGDLTSEDPFVKAINQGIQKDIGVSLDELLNPAKVVNLERDLYVCRTELAQLTGATLPADVAALDLTTVACDGGGGGEAANELRTKITKKETDLAMERRSVFRGWLKNIFLGQAILSFGLSYVMATNPRSLFGSFDWYYSYNMDISISVLGYWWWWLFVVPSLRSRRPTGSEKKALDIAFLGTPAVSILAPVLTKDTGVIWAANLAVVVAAYAYAFLLASEDGAGDDDNDDENSGAASKRQQPEWLKFVFKSLDFGSGKERGLRK